MEYLKQETPQIILFRDRKEYKKKGVYHNINGPAIESLNQSQPHIYYINGKRMEFDEWTRTSTVLRRKRKMKKNKI
jgi:hypothetical protein